MSTHAALGTGISTVGLVIQNWNTQFLEKPYEVKDTLEDGKYNIMSELAKNPVSINKVVMTYCSGTTPNYDATKVLKIRNSNDRGRTFGTPKTAYNPNTGGITNLCVQEQHGGYSSDGRLHILCTLIDDAAACTLKYLYSDNNGTTFTVTDITALVSDVNYPVFRNSGRIIENNGVMLSTVYMFNSGTPSYKKICLRLVSGTWEATTIETTTANETECAIMHLLGDNLLVLTRDDVAPGFIQYLSSDNGLTWTRQGAINFGIVPNYGWPSRIGSFMMNGEKIIAHYFPVHRIDLNYPLKVVYGRAQAIITSGLQGWDVSTLKTVATAVSPYTYIYHGDVLHYNNNYNAIGCWPSIKSDFSSAELLTFEIDTTDSATMLALYPEVVNASTDSDATAFNTAASITDDVQKKAINNLAVGLKTQGIWTKAKAIYPMIGGSATKHKFNLINPDDSDAAFRLTFAGTWVHSRTGAKPNGIDGYANTHLKPLTHLDLYSAHLGFYSRTNISEAGVDIGATIDTGTTYPCLKLRVRYTDGKGRFYCYNGYSGADIATGAVVVDSRGMTLGTRVSNILNKIFYRGIQSGVTNTTTALNTTTDYEILIGADGFNGVAATFTTKECALATIGDGLSDAEVLAFNTLVDVFQYTLGRKV